MSRRSLSVSLLGFSLSLLVACGGGGGGSGSSSGGASDGDAANDGDLSGRSFGGGDGSADSETGLTGEVSRVPVVGQFLAACTETGLAVIETFVAAAPAAPVDPPTAAEVLAVGDADQIPVIGGLAAGLLGDLEPVDLDTTLAMIPETGLPDDLPVIGLAPVVCSDAAAAFEELPDPSDAVGLVPVFDGGGDPVALVLATVGPAADGAAGVDTAVLDGGLDLLSNVVVSVVQGLL